MNFLEKDLENIIWESDNKKLQEKKLPISGKKYRQLRIGNYGILDLMTAERKYYYCYDNQGYIPYLNITVYELKKEKVGISAFLQALGYLKGIKTFLEDKKGNIEFKLNIVLCAKEVDTNSPFIYLVDMIQAQNIPNSILNTVAAYSFDYGIDGIMFNNKSGYNLVNTGFKNSDEPF